MRREGGGFSKGMNEAICFDRCKVMMHFFKHCSETGPDEGRVKQGLFSHCAKYKVMIAVLKLNISLDCALRGNGNIPRSGVEVGRGGGRN